MVARAADDGRYWFFLIIPREAPGSWFLMPEHLFMIGAAVLLCYWLAFHLTGPLRDLQRAVERFGRGDLSARVNSTRRDELGQLARTFDRMAGRIETLLAAERRLLGDISHELRSPLARLGVAVELAREPVTVEGDPELLRRAVENVIRNAIRYTPRGSAVEVSLARRNGSAVVDVRDYGPGVPEEAVPRLFDAFYRVESDRDRSSGGIGLGLSIARRAIQLHKGSIRAQKAPPGLEVELELPVAAEMARTPSAA
jgi:signal transduction histidine kinase